MPDKSSQRSAHIPRTDVPQTLREFDLSGTKPILPRRRKRELVSPPRRPSASRRSSDHGFHRTPFGPGCSRSSAVPSPGVASWAERHLRMNSTPSVVRRRTTGRRARYSPHPCQARISNPSAAAKFPRRARTLTIFPCSAKPMQILPDQRFFGLQQRTG
jgi:hypothetical protein